MQYFKLYLTLYIILINIISFFAMYSDKKKAQNGKFLYRTSEKTLFTYALFLGSIGIYMGMYVFRHKTKHFKFIVGIPIMFILNVLTIYYLSIYVKNIIR